VDTSFGVRKSASKAVLLPKPTGVGKKRRL